MQSKDLGSDWRVMQFGSEYLAPEYYDRILKKYGTQDGLHEDLDLLTDFLNERPSNGSILELGCGSGRATRVITDIDHYHDLTVTDLSKQMLDFVQRQEGSKISEYEQSDHIEFLQKAKKEFNTIISLWSFAHSVFPWYARHGQGAFKMIEDILTNFFVQNLKGGGAVFIIQTDGASEEQKLIKQSWFLGDGILHKRLLESEYYSDFQSPSIRILDSVFATLLKGSIFDSTETNVTQVTGNEIEYDSLDEALEIFMNFHLEGEFNGTPAFTPIYDFLKLEFEKIVKAKGKLAIGTGFWIYKAKKK
ncbi:MAG: ubiE/COQ5 methyltransferase family protein [Candidatus Kaiserbacteria bacterium]|nr:ubiE/COQ5 methyltransferase family protein [Candidatus Kaiserbacteria bacterium]